MQVTQIFFDVVEADGRKWAAVIGHGAGGRSFHSLRGGVATKRAASKGRGRSARMGEARMAVSTDGGAPRAVVQA